MSGSVTVASYTLYPTMSIKHAKIFAKLISLCFFRVLLVVHVVVGLAEGKFYV